MMSLVQGSRGFLNLSRSHSRGGCSTLPSLLHTLLSCRQLHLTVMTACDIYGPQPSTPSAGLWRTVTGQEDHGQVRWRRSSNLWGSAP